jgi:hypothetical protein
MVLPPFASTVVLYILADANLASENLCATAIEQSEADKAKQEQQRRANPDMSDRARTAARFNEPIGPFLHLSGSTAAALIFGKSLCSRRNRPRQRYDSLFRHCRT